MAAFDLPYDHFIIIGLDEKQADASGCSIDGLFRMLKQINTETGIDFLNRNQIAFKKENNILLVERNNLKERISEWNGQTITFNNVVSTKAQLHNDWLVPAEATWLKRYLLPIST